MEYKRIINLKEPLRHRSLFLFGPRQTGKTTLLRKIFPAARYYNLLEADTFQELSANPALIRQSLKVHDKLIVIDEIQKLPVLLDEVHTLIESKKDLRFVLTGSSARKLMRGGANLLAGRAWIRKLHPLVSPELNYRRLLDRLNRGSIPSILDSPHFMEDLKAYTGTYLQEEIRAEGLVRSIENFSRFLLVAGLTNGSQLNYENVARDANISARTTLEYYRILVDTLLGLLLEPFSRTVKRKAVGIPKFYFFDIGVANFLMRRGSIQVGSAEFGAALEHQIVLEVRAALDYFNSSLELHYWRSTTKLEVDLTIGEIAALEVKAKSRVSDHDLKGLRALKEEKIFKRYMVVSLERQIRTTDDGIKILPVDEFFKLLWRGELFS